MSIFTGESDFGQNCDGMAEIRVVPSPEYVACIKLEFRQMVKVLRVSMSFYVDMLDEGDELLYNSGNKFGSTSSGVAFTVYNPGVKYVVYESTKLHHLGSKLMSS